MQHWQRRQLVGCGSLAEECSGVGPDCHMRMNSGIGTDCHMRMNSGVGTDCHMRMHVCGAMQGNHSRIAVMLC